MSAPLRYRLHRDVRIEDFGEKSLVLACGTLRLREINASARKILALLDGERTVQDIARDTGMAAATVGNALLAMERQGMVRRLAPFSKERPDTMSDVKYLADPEVSFRQEDGDGGLLYNAETDSLEVINPVAVEIWTFLAAPRTRAEVVAQICAVCEGASRAQVEKDTGEFLDAMVKKGFIGIVEEPA